ncbi:hypothetical protein [Paenibacillus pinisoli]|nr:hypothetical protein [Paenibacillus pinisoli]
MEIKAYDAETIDAGIADHQHAEPTSSSASGQLVLRAFWPDPRLL